MKRIFTLVLALSLLLLSLASCDIGNPDETGSKLDAKEDDWYYGLDFQNKTIAVRYNESAASIYTMGPDEKGSDTVLDRCYDRNLTATATLGLKVDVRVGDNSVEYLNEIALMPTGAPDLVLTSNDQTISLALNNYIRDAKRAPSGETSYFDFSADCWYTDFMAGLMLDDTKYYGLAGDYFIDVIREAECLYMNTTYYAEKMPTTLPEFYSLVERGRFDADEMQNMIESVYEDVTDQGHVDEGDRLGLVYRHGISFYPWVYGTDAAVIQQDKNGEWNIIDNPTDYVKLVDGLLKICNANGSLTVPSTSGGTEAAKNWVMDKFRENRILFASTLRMGDLENTKMLNMDNKIAVVYPKVNESQDYYRTYVNYKAEIGMIPVQAKQNFTELSAYLQLLNEQSTDIVDQYFQESLKFKYSTEASGAGRMLDVIYDSIGSSAYKNIMDASQTESGYSMEALPQFVYVVQDSISKKQNTFTEKWASYRDAYRAGLEKLKGKYAALGE